MLKFGKKAGKGMANVGKSAATGAVSTGISVVSTPTRAITKAKIVSESHDASYYSEDASETGQTLEYFTEGMDNAFVGHVIRLSQQQGKPLSSTIPYTKLASATLPLIMDDIGFENLYETNSSVKSLPINQIIQHLKKTEGFTRYVPKQEVNRSKSTALWVESSGAIFCYSKSQAIGIGVKVARFLLSDLKEIRLGHKTQPFERSPPTRKTFPPTPELSFSLIFSDANVDLIAPSNDVYKTWIHGLERLASFWRSESEILREHWASFKSVALSYNQLVSLLHKMNLSKNNSKELLEANGIDKNSASLTFAQCTDLLSNRVWIYTALKKVFNQYSQGAWAMSWDAFVQFLRVEQKDINANRQQAEALLAPYQAGNKNDVSFEAFHSFLVSGLNTAIHWKARDVYQDMEQPLQHYYMYSSHNTYCASDQLIGDSHVDMYRRVLLDGARCVELDCWDGPSGEPVIYHGNTMTSKIYVRDVCEVIKNYSFVTSPYPVVLSIENHCTEPQQARMAEIFSIVFGNMLFCSPSDPSVSSEPQSPNQLKYRILLKGKATFPCKALAELMFMRSSKLPADDVQRMWYNCCSLTESAQKKTPLATMIESNKTMFTRIYPAGDRVGSSNYNPDPSWEGGSQLVALNLQSFDTSTLKNSSKFKDNGTCGYLLKPISLRTFGSCEEPRTLKVKLVGARNLPRRGGNHSSCPFAKIFIEGCKDDRKSFTTETVKGNGLNPEWSECEFAFTVTKVYCASLVIDFYDQKTTTSVTGAGSSSMKAVGGVGIGSITGIGKAGVSAVGTVVATGASVAPAGLGDSTSKGLASRLGRCAIPVSTIQKGYRVIRLQNKDGMFRPMSDIMCNFDVY